MHQAAHTVLTFPRAALVHMRRDAIRCPWLQGGLRHVLLQRHLVQSRVSASWRDICDPQDQNGCCQHQAGKAGMVQDRIAQSLSVPEPAANGPPRTSAFSRAFATSGFNKPPAAASCHGVEVLKQCHSQLEGRIRLQLEKLHLICVLVLTLSTACTKHLHAMASQAHDKVLMMMTNRSCLASRRVCCWGMWTRSATGAMPATMCTACGSCCSSRSPMTLSLALERQPLSGALAHPLMAMTQ